MSRTLPLGAAVLCIAGCLSTVEDGATRSSSTSDLTSAPTAFAMPDPNRTPGKLCTPDDPNFDKYDYPAHVARCKRNVSQAEKKQVAAAYGVPQSDWSKYEFDHYIPLSAGGSNAPENLWPQPLAEAHDKDNVELAAYNDLKSGHITQEQAIAMIRAWRPSGQLAPASVRDEDDAD